jgi:hypothetical protein
VAKNAAVNHIHIVDRLSTVPSSSSPDCLAAHLSGSWDWEDAPDDDRIRVGVVLRGVTTQPDEDLGASMASDLERAAGSAVEVVILDGAPPETVLEILRDGPVVLDRVPRYRARFEARVRALDLDLEPALRRYPRYGPR